MISNATSLTGRGLRDWLIQRVTAVVIAAYVIVLAWFWCSHPEMSYEAWHDFFSCMGIKVLSSVAWLSLVLHAWIGLWTIMTDYIKSLWLRLTLQTLISLSLLGLLFWGIFVFWGV